MDNSYLRDTMSNFIEKSDGAVETLVKPSHKKPDKCSFYYGLIRKQLQNNVQKTILKYQ
jgi:hypothetical protein